MIEEKERRLILNEIILGYRTVIEERYDYKNLKKRIDLPKSYNKERSILFKEYFLNYMYPLPEKREVLNEAFESLDNYIKHPDKLLRILIDSSSIIFKFGRHLPKIFNAGIKALRAFRSTSKFEETLVEQAILLELKAPYSVIEINKLIETLPQKDIRNYMKNIRKLFDIIRDSELVSKILRIVGYIIKMMKNRPKTYTKSEIKGLEIGQEIIIAGDNLFDKLEKEDQLEIFNFILKMESEILGLSFTKI